MNATGYTFIIAITVLTILAPGCSASRNSPQYPITELVGTTLEGDTIHEPLMQGSPTAVIFYNGYSCKACFSEIDSALGILVNHKSIGRVSVVARVGNSAYAQREATKVIRNIMRPDHPILFDLVPEDVVDPWPPQDLAGGLFGRFNVDKTPALLLLDTIPGKVVFLDYDSLGFGDEENSTASHNLAERIQDKISMFQQRK